MRKLLKAGGAILLSVAAADHLGCQVTDYSDTPIPSLNVSHGILACDTDRRFANAQQTIEPMARDLRTGIQRGGCLVDASPDRISMDDARDWARFLGAYSNQWEIQIVGSGALNAGYVNAGIKALPDGSRRIMNFWYPLGSRLDPSCVHDGVGGDGGTEGMVVAEGWTQPGEAAPRKPGLSIYSIAIDSRPGAQTCENIVALIPGTTTFCYWVSRARLDESRLAVTPVARREGLAEFLRGGAMTVQWQDMRITGRGSITDEGRIAIELLGLERGEATFEASDVPLRFTFEPGQGFRVFRIDARNNLRELERIGMFMVMAGMVDREIELGQVVPELGIRLPAGSVYLVGESWRRLATGEIF